jgi:methionyl-tRNA formyltransferase
MRFAIATSDSSLAVFEAFLAAGWEPVKLFVSSPSGAVGNQKVIELAQRHHISVQMSRLLDSDLQNLGELGCDALIVADYKWRIGLWQPHLKYAVNFHPSPLPEARGPYPMVRAILENRKSWAVSCHKLAAEFDTGAILAEETFPLDETDCHESLNLKIQMAAVRLAGRVANHFTRLWDQATPQGKGDYWPNPTQEDQQIDFSNTVDTIMRQVRAFGLMGCLATVNGILIYVRRAVAWKESHQHLAGTLAHVNHNTMVIAAGDGFIGILEWSLASPDAPKLASVD